MKRLALLVALLAMLCGTEAEAVSIEFDFPNGPYSGHIDSDGFRISTANNWRAVDLAVGNRDINPQPNQLQMVVDSNTGIIDNGELKLFEYNFESVDLSSSGGTTTFIINGKDDVSGNANNVFAFTVTLTDDSARILNPFIPNLSDPFVPQPTTDCTVNLDCQIQRLFIAVVPSSTSSYKIDNVCFSGGAECPSITLPDPNGPGPAPVIVTTNVIPPDVPPQFLNLPEPASLLLLSAGLAGIGIWRRKAAKRGELQG